MPLGRCHDVIGNVASQNVDHILGQRFAPRFRDSFCIALEQLRDPCLEAVVSGKIQIGAGGFGHGDTRVGEKALPVHCTDITGPSQC